MTSYMCDDHGVLRHCAIIDSDGIIRGVGENVSAAFKMADRFGYEGKDGDELPITERVYNYVMVHGGDGIALVRLANGMWDLDDKWQDIW